MQANLLLLSAVEYGWYISIWKVLIVLAVVMLWARLLTWADKDAEAAHLPRVVLNTAFLGGLVLAFVLFLFLPGFWVALAVLGLVMLAEIVTYLVLRNQTVGLSDLSKQFQDWIRSFTSREKTVKAEEGEVLLIDRGGRPFPPPESDAPERAAYVAAQDLLTEPLRRGADRIEMRPAEGQAASVRYWVDGVAIDGRSIPREDAAAAVVLFKQLAGLDLNDRRKPQTGTIRAQLDAHKHELQVTTAGSTAGESVTIEVNPRKRHELRLDQLGFTDEQLAILEETVAEGDGIVLLAAPKGHGLTTLNYAVLRRHDAFLSHIQTIEREPSADLEGITQNALSPNAPPAEEAKLVNWVTSQEPDVLLVDRVEDPRSAADLIRFAGNGHRAYIGIRAASTFDALQAWRNLVGDDRLAMKNLKLVVAGRLLRKLCNACKMDYTPDPDTLRRLNMPPEKVGKLYTARTQPLRDQRGHEIVCEFCLDLRFKGRTGVYELFVIDDEVKQVVMAGGSVNQLKMLFKKQRQKYLQENALARAVAGETSLQEVARVLRAGESGSAASVATPSALGAPGGGSSRRSPSTRGA
ncbi:ATPase, T2SS/T4P/T4SS family [Fontivita pretiosa]|uniref:ATPase, T2SS/T4P/T4SS family n=1 Tax=Fontivita pretiosa TaxID=2989684 RepID=UPI003D179A3A